MEDDILKRKRPKKANFSDLENVCLLEEVKENYGLITQSDKVAAISLKKRGAWKKIAVKVNAIGGQGRVEASVKKRWKDMRDAVKNKQKAALKTGGGPPDVTLPYEDYILDILGDNTNVIDGIHELDDEEGDTFYKGSYDQETGSQVLVTELPVRIQEIPPDAVCGLQLAKTEDDQVYNISVFHSQSQEGVSQEDIKDVPVYCSTPNKGGHASQNMCLASGSHSRSEQETCITPGARQLPRPTASRQLEAGTSTSVAGVRQLPRPTASRQLEEGTSTSVAGVRQLPRPTASRQLEAGTSTSVRRSILGRKRRRELIANSDCDSEDEEILTKKWLKSATKKNNQQFKVLELQEKKLELEIKALERQSS